MKGLWLVLVCGCAAAAPAGEPAGPYVMVLGIAQDGGAPQAGCRKACCGRRAEARLVSCLAIVDPASGERWLVDATPDLRAQLSRLDAAAPGKTAGVLLTHAHIGHYTGLMQFGREVMGTKGVPVYAMPRMREFLSKNGPWDQLVRLGNISIVAIEDSTPIRLNARIRVTPFRVPHRDEYSETVGFWIEGPRRTIVYIPDIDKWERWSRQIEDVIASADVAYLDGTFYANGEIPGRDMSEIPHPFIAESLERFSKLDPEMRARVRYIHLNHTNPALRRGSDARREIERAGMRVAEELERESLD